MDNGVVVSKVTHKNGLTKILVKGRGKERSQQRWVCSLYGHLIQPGSWISWRSPSIITAKAPWADCTMMLRRIREQ